VLEGGRSSDTQTFRDIFFRLVQLKGASDAPRLLGFAI
jgi:hypothetical protein